MNNNNGIFNKIINFIKQIFLGNNKKLLTEGQTTYIQKETPEQNETNTFREQIIIPRNTERERLLILRNQWENGLIQEEDISEQDIDAIVAIYNEETIKIEQETEQIKQNIAKILKELKQIA